MQAGVSAVLGGLLSLPTGGTAPMVPAGLAAPGGDGDPLFVRPGFVTSGISQASLATRAGGTRRRLGAPGTAGKAAPTRSGNRREGRSDSEREPPGRPLRVASGTKPSGDAAAGPRCRLPPTTLSRE